MNRKLLRVVRTLSEAKRKKLEQRAMRPEDVHPCPDCLKRADPSVKGFDDKWRCIDCHMLHVESVYHEAGESDPNPGSEKERLANILAVKKGEHGDRARRQSILDRFGNIAAVRNTFGPDSSELAAAAADGPNLAEQARGSREQEIRANLIRKYGVGKR